MDLGIAGKKALVCGASSGLGYACAQALVDEFVEVWVVARTQGPLHEAVQRLNARQGGSAHAVVADVTTPAGRKKFSRPKLILISSSPMLAAHRPETSGSGMSRYGWPHCRPICSRPSKSSRQRSTA